MHDLRFALRLIRRNWTFSLTAILILALCIGANTAVLSVVNAAILRPLPYPQPERLAAVVSVFRGQDFESSVDGATWELVRDRVPSLEPAAWAEAVGVNMGVNGTGTYIHQQRVSAGFFHVLGVSPEIGREFTVAEDRAGGPAAVILTHALWRKYFGADRDLVGRAILLRGEPYTVVGIMPAGFRAPGDVDLWTPLRPSRKGEGGGSNYGMIARLRPGASWQQASAQLALLTGDIKREASYGPNADVRIDVVSLLKELTQDLRRPLTILWTAVAAVFVLGCVNIGGMLLARASGRVGEVATRLALGASAAGIVRQLLMESLVLGLLGGLASVFVGWSGLYALRLLGASTFSFLATVELDWRVLMGTLVLTLLAAIGFGLVPAWQTSRVDLRSAQTGARTVAGRKRFVSLGALVGGQVALTVPLLAGAGLLLRTFLYLWNLNPGFDPNHVMTARFSLQDARYATSQKVNQLFDKTVALLHQTPGIESAAVALTLPYERALNTGVRVGGQADDHNATYHTTNLIYVTPEYFAALRIPLEQGRLFTTADGPGSAPVAIVNRAFVRRYFRDTGALGQPVRSGKVGRQIVGIVGDVQEKRAGWGDFGPIAQVPTMLIPAAQTDDPSMQLVHTWFSPSWIVRSSLSGAQTMAAIGNATRSADPLLPMAGFRSIADLKMESLTSQRFLAALVGAIAGLAMLLTALGIYGLIANLVAERTRELGIRMALGSSAAEAIGTALKPGLSWVLIGVLSGGILALAMERFLHGFLWGVQPSDPVTLAGVAAGLLVATGVASVVPAARILCLNPADTLRNE